MRYSLVPLVTTSVFTILTSASSSIPQGCTHQESWGNAVVKNQCSDPIYFILDNQQGTATIAGSQSTSIPIYEKDADKGGMSIKMFKDKNTDIWAVPAITQFEITAAGNLQYFDISNVNSNIGNGKNGNGEDCDKEPPFLHDGMHLSIPDGKDIHCKAGENPCKTAYSKNNDDFATSATAVGNDITLTMCPDGGSGSKGGSAPAQPQDTGKKVDTNQGKSNQAPAPQQPDAPQVKVEAKAKSSSDSSNNDADADIVWVTQVVNAAPARETVYFNENGQQLQQPKEKRQEHIHQHIHNKIHKRRHGA